MVQTYFNKGTCKHDFSGSYYVVTEYDLKIYFSNKYCGFFSQKKVNQLVPDILLKIIENLLQILKFYQLTHPKFLTKAQHIQKRQLILSINCIKM